MLKFVQTHEGDDGPDNMEFTVHDLEFTANISFETLGRNLKAAIARQDAMWLKDAPAHEGTAIIAAGGPSLANELEFIRVCQQGGETLFAVNNVPAYLAKSNITPDCHVLLDSLPSVMDFVHPEIPMVRYYSSQCDPGVLDMAPNCILWTPDIIGLADAFPDLKPPFVGGGTTVGTRAIGLAYLLGYRKFRLIGLDCSHDGERGHAYEQAPYADLLTVTCGGRKFTCPAQLMAQAEEFQHVIPQLLAEGCEVSVYGDGLLRAIADEMAKGLENAH